MSVPTIVIFKNGEIVETMIGAASKEKFVENVNYHALKGQWLPVDSPQTIEQ